MHVYHHFHSAVLILNNNLKVNDNACFDGKMFQKQAIFVTLNLLFFIIVNSSCMFSRQRGRYRRYDLLEDIF